MLAKYDRSSREIDSREEHMLKYVLCEMGKGRGLEGVAQIEGLSIITHSCVDRLISSFYWD